MPPPVGASLGSCPSAPRHSMGRPLRAGLWGAWKGGRPTGPREQTESRGAAAEGPARPGAYPQAPRPRATVGINHPSALVPCPRAGPRVPVVYVGSLKPSCGCWQFSAGSFQGPRKLARHPLTEPAPVLPVALAHWGGVNEERPQSGLSGASAKSPEDGRAFNRASHVSQPPCFPGHPLPSLAYSLEKPRGDSPAQDRPSSQLSLVARGHS